MRDQLYYSGKNLEDFGAFVIRQQLDSAPSRVYTDVEVPGRHGKLLQDDKRLSNVILTYWMLILGDGWQNFSAMKNWLLAQSGYQRIEDTFDPEHYRMGVYRGATEPVFDRKREWCKCTIEFDCLPQRWYKSAEELRTITSGQKLVNPYSTQAKPLIRVTGIGTVTVSGETVTISSQPTAGYIDIDCEEEDAYSGSANCNGRIALPSTLLFPVLDPGENEITYSGLTSVKVAPRWWTI